MEAMNKFAAGLRSLIKVSLSRSRLMVRGVIDVLLFVISQLKRVIGLVLRWFLRFLYIIGHVTVRFFLLCGILLAILGPPYLLFQVLDYVRDSTPDDGFGEILKSKVLTPNGANLLISIGGLTFLLKKSGGAIVKSFNDLFTNIENALKLIFDRQKMPALNLTKAPPNLWQVIFHPTWGNIKNAFRFSMQFIGAIFFFQNKTPRHFIFMGTDQKFPSYSFGEGTVFSLPHIDNGSCKERRGVCLDEIKYQWLTEFKQAIEACADASSKLVPEVEVMGFASTAHFKGSEQTDQNQLNRQLANHRAEAVISFLVGAPEENWKCNPKGDLSEGCFQKGIAHPCEWQKEEGRYECGKDSDKLKFRLLYKPWKDVESMKQARPADDGDVPNPRRRDVEFLNRTVHIRIKNDVCRLDMEDSMPSPG